MPQELQIKALLLAIESKIDKNNHPYFRLSLQGSTSYFYAFSNGLNQATWTALVNSPHNFINRQVLITYQELPNKDNQGVFFKVKELQVI